MEDFSDFLKKKRDEHSTNAIKKQLSEHKPSLAEEKVNIFQSFLGCLVILFILFLIFIILYISSIPPIDNYGRY